MLAVPQKENSNRENAMSALNLKIEYVDGKLVSLEQNGTSFLGAGVTALYFSHTLKEAPLLKVEMGGNPVSAEPPPPVQQQPEPTVPVSTEPPKEGELLPPAQQLQSRGRRRRNRQRS